MKFSWVVRHSLPFSAKNVFDHLDERLFEVLQPPKWVAKIIRNDGVRVGDEIWVKLFFPIPGLWKTKIVDRIEQAPYSFTDESKEKLVFGMKYWKHIHRIVPVSENSCFIEEDIEWVSSNWLMGLLLNRGFWFMMKARRKTYQKYFEKIALGVDRK